MGKKHNGLAAGLSNWLINCKTDRSKLLKSVVSLVLASLILVTCTFCWYCLIPANGNANFELNAGKGLRVNDKGTSQFSSSDNNCTLKPASSVDGRNLFFPADDTAFSDVTKEMSFRSANAGDKNYNYIQIDFTLTAEANHTAIYINPEKTWLKVYHDDSTNETTHANALASASAQEAAPLRMAIWTSVPDDNDEVAPPIVFNSQAKTVTTAAVTEVDRASGAYISNGPQTAHQFSDYAYGGTPIATLSAGIETKISVIIWLEGTDPKCKWNKISAINKNDISLGLAFMTSWDNTEVIRFKDKTAREWIKTLMNPNSDSEQGGAYSLTMRYQHPTTNDTIDFDMYKYQQATNEWCASVPGDMKQKIFFILSPPPGSNEKTYIFCRSDGQDGIDAGKDNTNRGVNRQYVATYAEADANANENWETCQGHWVDLGDSDGGGIDIGDLDGDDF